MKKFYSFLFAAVALVGFAACNSDSTEEPAPAGVEKVSFKANIDTTKTDLDGLQTVWVVGDVVKVNGFNFICEEDLKTFTCTETGCSALQNETTLTAVYNEEIDSTKGTAGAKLVGEGNLKDGISFQIMSAFLKFTTTGTVTLKADKEIFYYNGAKAKTILFEAGAHYVAINPAENVEFSVESEYSEEYDAVKESKTLTFNEKMIYNLGELVGKAHESFGIVGAHQGWNNEAPDALYQIPNSNTYVRYNVTLAAGGFKFYGETSKEVTIEHPEVTGGETGDWYLIPNTNWKKDNARFAIYFFGDGDTWVSMDDKNGDGIYAANKPNDGKNYTHMIFCRMNPSAAANKWENKWNQTGNLAIPTDGNNCFSVPSGSWDNATTGWSVHKPVEHQDAWTEITTEITSYWIGYDAYGGNFKTGWATGWSNKTGENITLTDTNKTYDIYFSKGDDQNWDGTTGFEIYYTVLEHGSPAPELK